MSTVNPTELPPSGIDVPMPQVNPPREDPLPPVTSPSEAYRVASAFRQETWAEKSRATLLAENRAWRQNMATLTATQVQMATSIAAIAKVILHRPWWWRLTAWSWRTFLRLFRWMRRAAR